MPMRKSPTLRANMSAWIAFYRKLGPKGEVGIWHETYLIRPGQVAAIYNNMPPFGLGTLFDLQPATGAFNTAAARLHAGEDGAA